MIQSLKHELKSLGYIFQLFRNRGKLFYITLCLELITSLFPVATGLVIKVVFDQYAKGPINNPVNSMICLFLGLLTGRIFFVFFNSYFNTKNRFLLSADIRFNLIEAILEKPGAESLNLPTGDALNRIKEDAGQIEDFAFSAVLAVITSFVLTVIAIGILCTINLKMTMLIFIPIMGMVYIMERSGRRVSKYRLANRSATGNVSSAIGEMFTNIQSIQVNGAEDNVLSHLKQLNQVRAKSATQDNVFSQVLGTLYENLFNIGTGMILVFMALFYKENAFSLGDFVIFTYYMNFVSYFIMFSGNAFTRYKQIRVSFEHLCQLHESIDETLITKPSNLGHIKPMAPLTSEPLQTLKVKGLKYTYPSGQSGIGPLNFELKAGSLTVIAGRIGSGKSTLLKAVSGLLEVTEGTVYWNEVALTNLKDTMTPPRIAYTPQLPKFFSASLKENMCLGLEATPEQLDWAVHSAVFEPDLEGFTEGLDSPIGTNGIRLSGGQQLRLAVGRMFARDASLYAFDDIASALDVETQNIMWDRILNKRSGTYLAVSNQKRLLQEADQILLLKDGKLEAVGNLESLLATSEEMQLIYAG